jgi:hypothetical protein
MTNHATFETQFEHLDDSTSCLFQTGSSPKSDQHQTSPHNNFINTSSREKVMKIKKKMIIKRK